MENIVYIGLGSNLGDREKRLYHALAMLNGHPSIRIEACSSIYETDPYGPVEQPDFLNMVAQLTTTLSPLELLKTMQKVEQDLDRKRLIHWGPRTIDLDILLYNKENIKMENLKIPHPELEKRDFVILPLCEIAPNLTLPDHEESLVTLQMKFSNSKGVRLWKQNNGAGEFGLFVS